MSAPNGIGGVLTGRVALITGAAGAIGQAITRGFLAEGARCVLIDNHSDRLAAFACQIEAQAGPGGALVCCADVRDSAQVDDAVRAAVDRFGRIDILINNAAVTQMKRIEALDDADIDLIIDTNLKGYFKCARAVVRVMLQQRIQGSLVFVSSKNGLEGCEEKSLYCATKGAELVMARSLARELGPQGIRVNSICPDAVLEGSALWENESYRTGTCRRYGITEKQMPEYYRKRCALKTSIHPQDVADAALFLVSDRAAKITGQILNVDGGVAYVR
jgi:NAD(P)-dependent dehydrogenase (short-subunit alcohol dehydrogenase family)